VSRRFAVRLPLVLQALLVALPALHPLGAQPADAVAAARVVNERAYRKLILLQKETLTHRHFGRWIAIAGGRVLPAGKDGDIRSAKTIESCVRAAEEAQPGAVHRFVFRVGWDGDVECDFPTRYPSNLVLGESVTRRLGVVRMIGAPAERRLVWATADGRRQSFRYELGLVEIEVASPTGNTSATIRTVWGPNFPHALTVDAATAKRLGLDRFEIPGRVEIGVGQWPRRRIYVGRRAHLKIRAPALAADGLLSPVLVWPSPEEVRLREEAAALLDRAEAFALSRQPAHREKARDLLRQYEALPAPAKTAALEERHESLSLRCRSSPEEPLPKHRGGLFEQERTAYHRISALAIRLAEKGKHREAIEALGVFLGEYPEGHYAPSLKQRIASLEARSAAGDPATSLVNRIRERLRADDIGKAVRLTRSLPRTHPEFHTVQGELMAAAEQAWQRRHREAQAAAAGGDLSRARAIYEAVRRWRLEWFKTLVVEELKGLERSR